MKELNQKLEQACEKYRVTRQAYEALCETTSLDLREAEFRMIRHDDNLTARLLDHTAFDDCDF